MDTSYRGVKDAFDAAATTYDAVGRLDCYYKYLSFAVFGGRKSA